MLVKNNIIATIFVTLGAAASLVNAYSAPSQRVSSSVRDEPKIIVSPPPPPPSSTVAGSAASISTSARRPISTTPTPLSFVQKGMSTLALTAAFTLSATTTALAESLDYEQPMAEDTIDVVLQSLKDATGDAAKSFKVFETINDIITEGKGVGGSLSYSTFLF